MLRLQLLLDTKVLHQLRSFTLCFPSVHFGKFQFQVCSTVSVFFRHFRLSIKSLTLLHVLPKWLMAHQYCVHHAELVIFKVVLLQYGQTFAWSQFYSTLIRLKVATNSSKESRLSCTICANDTVDIAVCKLKVNVFIQDSLSELDSKIADCYHFCVYLFIKIYILLQRYKIFS